MKEQIQTSAEYLANLCLENAEQYHNYTDKDLENATLIFSHFFMDVIYTTNCHAITFEKQLEIAETTGKAIRELILSATGKDMHEIVKSSPVQEGNNK
jgi:hypothetical protein